MPNNGDLRVWHIPQVPGEPFHVDVNDPHQAQKVLEVLAEYDLFQLAHNIKPDFSNAAGLEIFDNDEWIEWEDEDGDDIDHTAIYGGRLAD